MRNKDLDSNSPLVVLMCGVVGAGKTTYAQQLEAQGYHRLSIDEALWARYGCYGIDYPPEKYSEYSSEVEQILRQRLCALIAEGRNVVVDFSFWQRERRQLYKALIEEWGGRWQLIYLKASPELLEQRLKLRSQRFDANAAFPITPTRLHAYLEGFEEPSGEGEIIIEQQ